MGRRRPDRARQPPFQPCQKIGRRIGKIAGLALRRSLGAAGWSVGGTLGSRLISLGSNLVMTRLLLPEAFGLMSMAMVVMSAALMVSDIGIRQSVVRDPRGEEPHFLRAAWTIQIVRACWIALLIAAAAVGAWAFGPRLAPPGSVYADPRLPVLIALSVASVLLTGLESTAQFRAHRRLDVRTPTLIAVAAQVAGLACMLSYALLVGASVWVLMGGALITSATRCALSHAAYRDVPMHAVWDRAIAAEMWRFGRWIIGSSVAGFVLLNGDQLIFGALMPVEVFGLYAIAVLWLQAGVLVLLRLGDLVIFAAQAEVARERRADLPRVMGRMRLAFDALLVVAFLAALFGGALFIDLIYPPEYGGAAGFLMLLSPRFLTLRQNPVKAMLLVEGRSGVMAAATAIDALVLIVGVPLAWHLGDPRAAVLIVALAPLGGAAFALRRLRTTAPDLPLRRDYVIVPLIAALGVGLYLSGAGAAVTEFAGAGG